MQHIEFPHTQRKRLLALIHLAKKHFNLDEDEYRTFLETLTGKRSAAEMDASELNRVYQAFESMGFKVTAKPSSGNNRKLSPKTRQKADKSQIDKIRALWIDCYQKGIVKNRYEGALNRFVQRMTKVDRVDWLLPAQAATVIEALKNMQAKGGVTRESEG